MPFLAFLSIFDVYQLNFLVIYFFLCKSPYFWLVFYICHAYLDTYHWNQGVKMEICNIKKITNCKHLNLFSIQYRDRVKTKKNWLFASRSDHPDPFHQNPGLPDAVVVVPYHKQAKKLVIIR